jgi:lipopolysaccharide export system protein LptC
MPDRRLLTLAVLLLAALFSGWLAWDANRPAGDNSATDQEPVLVIDGVRAVRMNDQGLREYTLVTPRLRNLPGKQGTWLEQPALETFRDGAVREWLIEAERGWIAPDKTLIRLEGAVTMTRLASSGRPPMVIHTRDVSIRPQQDYAETAAPARAETPDGVLTGTGLQAYMNSGQLHILSQVRGYHVPPAKE